MPQEYSCGHVFDGDGTLSDYYSSCKDRPVQFTFVQHHDGTITASFCRCARHKFVNMHWPGDSHKMYEVSLDEYAMLRIHTQ